MGKRHSTKTKERILAQIASSGLSRAAYCRKKGLCYATISLWLKQGQAQAAQPRALHLLEIEPTGDLPCSTHAKASAIHVRVNRTTEIMFPASYDVSALARFCREASRC